jgi:hypothetical protein
VRLSLPAAVLLFLAFGGTTGAQEPQRVKLDLSVEQVQMLVETVEQLGCATVRQMTACQKAIELLQAIRSQAKAQVR